MYFVLGLLLSVLSFGSPVHIPVQLAGNFGEPRPHHFHGGIDVKTDREVNLGIYSIADGYVSRAVVEKYGYGQAIVVTHPNGYSSYYVHINRFAPQVEAAIRRWQYRHRQFAADIAFRPGEIPVVKGQLIALSGNRGASQGPHLHLEVHETRSNKMMDPLMFLHPFVKDKTPPAVYAFKTYPQPGEGVFQHSPDSRIFTFDKGHFQAWGKVGFGVRAYDHMDSVYNNYGVRFIRLYCDGKLVFSSDANGIPVESNRMVNSWGDYNHYLNGRLWFLKSFLEPGNSLPILKTGKDRGIVNFNQKRDYHMRYVVSDAFGNQTVKSFVVRGEPEAIPKVSPVQGPLVLRWNRHNQIEWEGVRLDIPGQLLPHDYQMQPKRILTGGAKSVGYSFSRRSFPLFAYGRVSINIGKVANPGKFYVASRISPNDGGSARYCGGEYSNGWLSGKMRELCETYYACYDNEAPVISKINLDPRHLFLRIKDEGSGIKGYEAYIDNQFVLFEQGKNKDIVFCDLDRTPVIPRKAIRTLRVVATDNRDNRRVFTAQIKY